MSAGATGGVFISYRRQESSGMAGRLYDRLAARFGDDQVFMDVDTIALGVDFAEVITQAVSTCQVLLAVIGPQWLTATDKDGRRRLDDSNDIVRLEIAAALERDIRVIPILVEGAEMPRDKELPESLAKLARRNSLSMRHESFRNDTERLLAAIEPILHSASEARGSSPPSPTATEAASATRTTPTKPFAVADSYTTVRGSMPAGPERTAMMDRIIEEAKRDAHAPDLDREEVLRLLGTGSEGARVWALGVLQARPELATTRAVLEAVERPDQMFDQYHALVLAERFVSLPGTRRWDRERIANAVQGRLESKALGEDYDSIAVARRVLEQVKKRESE